VIPRTVKYKAMHPNNAEAVEKKAQLEVSLPLLASLAKKPVMAVRVPNTVAHMKQGTISTVPPPRYSMSLSVMSANLEGILSVYVLLFRCQLIFCTIH